MYVYDMIRIFEVVGVFGPEMLVLLSIILLYKYKKITFLLVYLVVFVFNVLLNYILKGIFRQPRPMDDVQLFKIEELYKNKVGFDKYGMPSGHAQTVLYSTIFIHLVLNNWNITLFYLIISLITMYQRVYFKQHTVLQVIVGAILGMFVGWMGYTFGKKKVKGVE